MEGNEKPRSRRLEVAIVLALIATVAFLAWQRLGSSVKTKVRGASALVDGLPSSSGDAPTEEPPAAVPFLPQSGILATTFVGGHGAARRLDDLMDRGIEIDGAEVQLSAFQELGRLPYALPVHDAVGLHAELERSRLLEDGERVHLQIALIAREGEAPRRPRMDVRLVLDRSGSMEGESFRHAVAAAHALVDRLDADDTFGLVSYATRARTDLSPHEVGDGRRAHRAIDALRTGGSTNIEAALRAVARHPPRRIGAEDVPLVMLLSDGEATVGRADAASLSAIARGMFDANGVITTTVGLGTSFDEDVMLSIARESSGSYEFVRDARDIAAVLTEELEQRVLAVAADLRLRIELAPGVRVARVYGSRVLDHADAARVRETELAVNDRMERELGIASDRAVDLDTGLRMYLPTFRRADQHVVLMDLIVPAGRSPQIARVALDYKDLDALENRHAAVEVVVSRTTDARVAASSTRRSVERTVLALQAGETLRDAADALARGDRGGADRALSSRIAELELAAAIWHDTALLRDAQTLRAYRTVVQGAWARLDSSGQHTLVLAMGFHGGQRVN